ncbi:Translational regulator CsrA (plasmid) [Legionella sp. PC1000]|nr:Translational regulator CsrA [Legionella sp. PC1000]
MLILTRRIGETVVVGDDVFITILGIKGNQIRLGFDALTIFQFIAKKSI